MMTTSTSTSAAWILSLCGLMFHSQIQQATAGGLDCTSGFKEFNPAVHKKVYKIGVYAPEGVENSWKKHNVTFEEYLTETAGRRFVPPIAFEMVATETPIFDWVEDIKDLTTQTTEFDFFYADPGVFTCLGTEMGAQPIATTLRTYENIRAGLNFQLDELSGVIFTRKDRRDITTIQDLKDKVIAAEDISSFGRSQAHFYQMMVEGLNYIMDPKQVIFGVQQEDIVRGVLEGDWDIGMVRTGILETATDESGHIIDLDIFKVLNKGMHVMDNGEVFPFEHSTTVFPEWPFFSATDTPYDVIYEVQNALQALGDHRLVGELIRECQSSQLCQENFVVTSTNKTVDCGTCDTASIDFFDPNARCDTTRAIAELAWRAGKAGGHNGFRSPRSYFEVGNMQQAAGFLSMNEFGEWKCSRATALYEAITCPEGFHILPKEDFEESCQGECPDGMECFCRPCTEAFEIRKYVEEESGSVYTMDHCQTGEVCAHAEQTKEIIFKAHDNKMRNNADVRAVVTVGTDFIELPAVKLGNGDYEFAFSYDKVAVGTLEVYIDDLLIPGMPILLEIVPRDCEGEYGHRSPTETGACVCSDNSFEFGNSCMDTIALSVTISCIVAFCVFLGVCLYVRQKRWGNDQLWLINVEELHFGDPVEIIGQGGFGVVVLAQYRGTKVAIKRVVKPKAGSERARGGSVDYRGSVGSGSLGGGGVPIRDRPQAGAVDAGAVMVEDDIEAARSSGVISMDTMEQSVDDSDPNKGRESVDKGSRFSSNRGSQIETFDLDFLAKAQFDGGPQNFLQRLFPVFFKNRDIRNKLDVMGGSMATTTENQGQGLKALLCPWFDKATQQREDFMAEMRLLSKLRHPYITTVMGAVVSNFSEPMLVMEYMEYGSLYDLLRNETMYTGGDIILQIVRDVVQGLRFLHSSKPPIFHGDLKAKNILIDSRFRAKVADFGLSTKKNSALTGTPYFMAPEYLRRKSEYTAACDIYALGVIFFEIYARDDPYKGEIMKQVLMKVCNPTVNKRPQIPDTMPPKFVEITKKCWSADPYYRPQAKDLDMQLMEMTQNDAEPLTREQISGRGGEKKTMDMMYEVFPRHIADALKAGKKVEPEDHEMVTVFFSDIVGFTSISKKLSASKVCGMLDRLYGEFDKLSRAHQVFKVETIGDAYMGVTNLLGNQDGSHVKNIAEFAVEAIYAANKIYIDEDDEDLGTIKIRVGFHSGPVVSNVIGTLNPRYGLFGDTVNTASRMESISVAGKIHCSEKAAKLLQKQAPEMRVRQRGKVSVKGKGDMVTYWVSPKRKRADDPVEKLIDNKSFDCIVVADHLGNIKRVNKTAVRDFRYASEEEMIGLNVSDLVGGGIDAKTHDSYLASFHSRDKTDRNSTTLGRQRVLFSKRKDGTQFQCIVGINAISDPALEEDMLIGYIRCLDMGNDPGPAAAASSGCPVEKEKAPVIGGCPVKRLSLPKGLADTSGGCPVKRASASHSDLSADTGTDETSHSTSPDSPKVEKNANAEVGKTYQQSSMKQALGGTIRKGVLRTLDGAMDILADGNGDFSNADLSNSIGDDPASPARAPTISN